MHVLRTARLVSVYPWLLTALLVAGVTPPASAQTVTLNRDYDLVADNGLVHYSQVDSRWAYFTMRGDDSLTIGRCGCLLSAFSTVINHRGGMLPWFPTRYDYFGGSDGALEFNPHYLDTFFSFGPNPSGDPGFPSGSFPPGWGYKSRPLGSCGIIPLVQALQIVGTDGLGSAVGFTPVVHLGFGPDVKDIVNRNLIAGQPTIAAIRVGDSVNANHAVLIAGWDNDERAYRILDPMTPRLGMHGPNRPQVPIALDPGDPPGAADYGKYEMRIEGIIEMRSGGFSGSQPSFVFGDDPSPIEILMVGPDGRRTGVDPQARASFQENDGASYWTFGPWSDPTGQAAEGTAPRFIAFPNAPSGTYYFKVTGTANGPLHLASETMFGGTRVLLDEFVGTIAAGEVRKYELQFSRTGASTVGQVSNFTPHAGPHAAPTQAVNLPVDFSGRHSFDLDGSVVSYEWNFGDGATATGLDVSHAYTAPGTYTAVLTVSDEVGSSSSTPVVVTVIAPVAAPGAGSTELMSIRPDGTPFIGWSDNPVMSADGRFVAFRSRLMSNGMTGEIFQDNAVWLRDRLSGNTRAVAAPLNHPQSEGSFSIAISDDGDHLAFATNMPLVPEDTNTSDDIYVWNRTLGTTTLVSVRNAGGLAGGGSLNVAISGDGRFAAFDSHSPNIVPNDTNTYSDVFVRDLQSGTTELISVELNATRTCPTFFPCHHSPAISDDGRFVVWTSWASNLVAGDTNGWMDVFLRDRVTGVTELISTTHAGGVATENSFGASISADGRFVVFASNATNLVPGDTNAAQDIFVRDRVLGTTERVSVSSDEGQSVHGGFAASISATGRFVAFNSATANLVPSDTNGARDVFLRDREAGTTERIEIAHNGAEASGMFDSRYGGATPAISSDGRVIAFAGIAPNLVPIDASPAMPDVYARVRSASTSAPVAQPSGPYLGWADGLENPAYVIFDGSASVDPSGAPLTATWDFGDGSAPVTASTLAPTAHSYADAGRYTVSLRVTNGSGQSPAETTTVEILPPLAHALNAIPPCFASGAGVSLVSSGHSVVPVAGGWNLANGPVPPIDAAILGSSFPMTFEGPAGSDLSPLLGVVSTIGMISPMEFFLKVPWTTRSAWTPGDYTVRSEVGSTRVAVPCPQPANALPLAVAGGPYTVRLGAPLTLDGSGSSDADGDALSYRWELGDDLTEFGSSPTHTYGQTGRYYVTLTVNDGHADSVSTLGTRAFTFVDVVANDAIAPVTTPTLSALPNAAGWHRGDVTVVLSAVDNEGGSGVRSIVYSASGGHTIPATTVDGDRVSLVVNAEGSTTITFSAIDVAGNAEVPATVTMRIDRTAPVMTCGVAPGALWPPNHQLVPIAVSLQTTDAVSGPALARLVAVSSNEPDNGLGDGHTDSDMQGWMVGTPDAAGWLRAERSGTAIGRFYTLAYEGLDVAGNTTACFVTVAVQHDQRE